MPSVSFFLFWGREEEEAGPGRAGPGRARQGRKKKVPFYFLKTQFMSILFINQFPFEFTGPPAVRKWADVGWDRGLVGFLRTWPIGHVFGVCTPQGCACGMQVGPWSRACRVSPGTVERRYSQTVYMYWSCCI